MKLYYNIVNLEGATNNREYRLTKINQCYKLHRQNFQEVSNERPYWFSSGFFLYFSSPFFLTNFVHAITKTRFDRFC